MGMIRAMRTVNVLIDGTMAGPALETALTTGGLKGDWVRVCQLRGQMAAVAASSTAMAAVIASSTAMAAVAASSTAMAAVIASSTAMAAVIDSSTAMAAVAASSTAKLALYASDTALAALAGSATALAAMRAASQYAVYSKAATGTTAVSWDAGVAPSVPPAAGKYILVGASWANTTPRDITVNTLRSGSDRPNSGPLGAVSNTNADALTLCAPITGPITTALNGTGTQSTYLGLLRCDI